MEEPRRDSVCLAGAGRQPVPARGRVEAGLDQGTSRGHRAGDALPQGPFGGERDQGCVRISPVAVFERLLNGPKRVGVHVRKVARSEPAVKSPGPGARAREPDRSPSRSGRAGARRGGTESRRGSSTDGGASGTRPPGSTAWGCTRPYRPRCRPSPPERRIGGAAAREAPKTTAGIGDPRRFWLRLD